MIPKTFKIAGLNFTVEEVDNIDDGSKYGIYNDAINKITLANRVKLENDFWYYISEENKINTFYHELFHVFHYLWNNETPEDEAQIYANFMCEFNQTKE